MQMASSRPVSPPVEPPSTSSSTPIKSASKSIPTAVINAAATSSAVASNATAEKSVSQLPIQHTSSLTAQSTNSVPTATSTPKNLQSTSNSSLASAVTSPSAVPSDINSSASTHSSSKGASAWGAICAVLGVLIALAVCFFILRRRRARRSWDPQRLPSSNFGKYEGEIISEKHNNIEDTLAADLARLRSLDLQPLPFPGRLDAEPSKRSLDFSPNQIPPGGFKIARKPSLRIQEHVPVVCPSPNRDLDFPDTVSAPAYDAQEYLGDPASKESHLSGLPKFPRACPDFH